MSASPSVFVADELRELIPRFLAHRRVELKTLREAIGVGDLEDARRIGHSLKGVGGGYGFDEITRIGGEIECAARAGRTEALPGLAAELARYLEAVEVKFE